MKLNFKNILTAFLLTGLLVSCSGNEMPLIGISSVDQKKPARAATFLSYVYYVIS